jgi:hypothetical protein
VEKEDALSAYSIGLGERRFRTTGDKKLPEQLMAALGVLVKWLPAEVVGGYAAAVTMLQPTQIKGEPAKAPVISTSAWVLSIVATPILVLAVALAAKKTKKLAQRVVLSVPAFALWSASVPHSVWENMNAFRDNRPVFLLGLLFATALFSAIAEILTRE